MPEQLNARLCQGPAVEPVTLEDAKAWLKVDGDAEDALLCALIAAARLHVERSCGMVLMSQRWTVTMDRWPSGGSVALPLWPVAGILSIEVQGEEGEKATIDPSHYLLAAARRPASLVLRPDREWPEPARSCDGIMIRLEAGFGDEPDDVPGPLRQAVRTLVAGWYENREAPPPPALRSLLLPYMEMRLR